MPFAPPSTRAKLLFAGGVAALSLAATAGAAWAWGATGHRLIGRVAMESLPAELPAFLRTTQAVDAVGEIAREPDRSKGAGQPHDADLDPGHYVDVTDDGHVFNADGPPIDRLPKSREDYDVVLTKAGIDPFKAGYLPYNLMDGYQQLTKDFAYWRIETAILKRNLVPEHKAWIESDRLRREALIIRDLGYWAHFVGDGSQPFHASIHFNGWGDYPNPEGFTQDKVHGPFEGAFVAANVSEAEVRRALPAPTDCGATIQACVGAYLTASKDKVVPYYQLYKAGGFSPGDPRGKAFAVERVSAGAAMLRDLIVRSWSDSERQGMGYKPSISAAAVESGRPDPKELWADLYGDD